MMSEQLQTCRSAPDRFLKVSGCANGASALQIRAVDAPKGFGDLLGLVSTFQFLAFT